MHKSDNPLTESGAPPCLAAATALIEELRPGSLLCIGAGCERLIAVHEQNGGMERRMVSQPDPAMLETLGSFDFAVAMETLEPLDKQQGGHLLARLRDLHGGHFAVQVRMGDTGRWAHNELLAFGLVLLARCSAGAEPVHLYGFDLHTYKPTPDWLNPAFWAHPELWDKYWW